MQCKIDRHGRLVLYPEMEIEEHFLKGKFKHDLRHVEAGLDKGGTCDAQKYEIYAFFLREV